MNRLFSLTKRNCKLFFNDKGQFFVSLINPIILLVLYMTFLGNVFKTEFTDNIVKGFEVSESIIDAVVGGQLFASILSVSCVTVAFCSNLMVQDKYTGARKDLLITPLKKSTLAISYYLSTLISTLIICTVAMIACLIYIAIVGFYMSFTDILLVFLDMFLISMFGTALSSFVNHFLSTQGQASAVGTIVGTMYGFISGAYMPIASFGVGLQKTLMFFPSTYATSLFKQHALNGALNEFAGLGVPNEVIVKIKDNMDINLYFFGNEVSTLAKYLILIGTIVLVIGLFVLVNYIDIRKTSSKIKSMVKQKV